MGLMDNFNLHISFLGVLLAALAYFILGAIWYSPKIFGKHYPSIHEDFQPHPGAYIGEFVIDLVIAYVLSLFIHVLGVNRWADGYIITFWLWLGFVVTTHLSGVIWSRRTVKGFLVNVGFNLIGFLAMATIIGFFKPFN